MSYDYKVYSPTGRAIMRTAHESCRYPPQTEAQMLALGYRITVNGKRLTKKAASEQTKSRP